MKQRKFLMLGACAMALTAFTSCEQEIINEFPAPPTTGEALTVVGTVEGAISRATDTAWEAGDSIGITAYGIVTNAKYSTTNGDGIFSASGSGLYLSDATSHTFYAYYPYTSAVENNVISINVCDSANVAAQKHNDFMVASATLSASNKKLQLQFRHAMARVIINVKTSTEDGFAADDVFSTSSCGALSAVYTKGTLNIESCKLSSSGYLSRLYMVAPSDDITNHVRQYVVYLTPQPGCKFELIYNRGTSKEQVYSVKLTDQNWFGGYSYTYNVTAKREGLDLTSASTITDWTSSSDDLSATLSN
jgi:hypothetical protein